MHIGSYPSIFNLGHKAIQFLTSRPVIVEEKVDGSQFSMGVSATSGELMVRSKGATVDLEAPAKMFVEGVATAKKLQEKMTPGFVYRGEYLKKAKHNTLAYDRVPKDHVILFDINTGVEEYLSPYEKRQEAERLGLEVVPHLFEGMIHNAADFRVFLERDSVLGGQKVEGVVIKPADYGLFGLDKHVIMGKFVSEAFKEIHAGEWKKENPSSKDIVDKLIERYKTPARWGKAVQHLAEAGTLKGELSDIGILLREVKDDILKEEREQITEALFSWAWEHIARGVVGGLPQWYKEELMKKQFEQVEEVA